MVVLSLGVAVGLLAVVAVLLFAAGRARARAIGEEVRAQIEPYLRRKGAESGLPGDAPTWTARTSPETIVGYSARLAGRLLDMERTGPLPAQSSTKELELAKTQPVSDSDAFVVTDRESKTAKR
jgi:hypothetical protein